jgi:orotate phosphoribosyltransferase
MGRCSESIDFFFSASFAIVLSGTETKEVDMSVENINGIVVWTHDGNPKRPYARLTSGLISDGFANCTPLIARPKMLRTVVRELIGQYRRPSGHKYVVVGQAMGSITVASHIAEILDFPMWWSTKINDMAMQIDKRFDIDETFTAIIVEDTTTTGGTTVKTKEALQRRGVACADFMYTLMNRSSASHVNGMNIRSVVQRTIISWKQGENPHTEDGQERVAPLDAKRDWHVLTGEYP